MPEAPDLVELELPAEPESMDTVHDALDELWARHEDVDAALRFQFTTALMEILGNVVEHAYRPEVRAAERRLEVSVAVHPDRVQALVGDNGRPVELDLSTVVMPDEDAESGRGIALAREVLDELAYERDGGRNTWRLVSQRPAP